MGKIFKKNKSIKHKESRKLSIVMIGIITIIIIIIIIIRIIIIITMIIIGFGL